MIKDISAVSGNAGTAKFDKMSEQVSTHFDPLSDTQVCKKTLASNILELQKMSKVNNPMDAFADMHCAESQTEEEVIQAYLGLAKDSMSKSTGNGDGETSGVKGDEKMSDAKGDEKMSCAKGDEKKDDDAEQSSLKKLFPKVTPEEAAAETQNLITKCMGDTLNIFVEGVQYSVKVKVTWHVDKDDEEGEANADYKTEMKNDGVFRTYSNCSPENSTSIKVQLTNLGNETLKLRALSYCDGDEAYCDDEDDFEMKSGEMYETPFPLSFDTCKGETECGWAFHGCKGNKTEDNLALKLVFLV